MFLDDEHKGCIEDLLRVLFHVHATTNNVKIRELVLAVYPAIGKKKKRSFEHFSFVILM